MRRKAGTYKPTADRVVKDIRRSARLPATIRLRGLIRLLPLP
ncbi:hypothetical protein Ga0609869_000040 [Rhodovulum iodosum]|uniref:Uncharacterized protein n=1 Tax=Rhodovulum iodosum TaxID=68291 RepID=A0ABV3XQF7_9RHOB|nr:hypothetical protein [Rhodovulum robiginosum]